MAIAALRENGYEDAAEAGGYEASNSLFDYTSGSMLVEATLELIGSED